MFSLIAAIGQNHELGKNGQLLFHLKEDTQFFKQTTTGHKVLMGRKTWESLPGKLKNRQNLVVSHHQIPGTDQTITDLSKFISTYQYSDEEIFIIGGGVIYSEFLKFAKHLYLTEVSSADSSADTFFPTFDKSQYTKKIIKKGSENGLNFTIAKYTKL